MPFKFWSWDWDNETTSCRHQYLLTNHPTPWTPKFRRRALPQTEPPLQWLLIDFCRLRCTTTTTMTGLSIPWFCLSLTYAVFLWTTTICCFLCTHITWNALTKFGPSNTPVESFWDGPSPSFIFKMGDVRLWPLRISRFFLNRCILNFGGWRNLSNIYWGVLVIYGGSYPSKHILPRIWKLCRSEDIRTR